MSKTLSEEDRIDQTRRELAVAGRADQADQLGQEANVQLALLQQANENISRLRVQLEQAGSLSGQLEEMRRLSSQLEQAGHRLEGWNGPVAPVPASRPNGLVRLLGLAGVFLLGAVLGPALGARLSNIDWESVRRWSEGVWTDRAYRLGPTSVVATPLVSGDAGTAVGVLGQQPAEPPVPPDVRAPAKEAGQAHDERPSAAEDAHVSRQSEAVPIEPASSAPLPDVERVDPWSDQRPETGPEVAQPARARQQSAEDPSAPVPPALPEDPLPANPQAVEPPMPAVESAPEAPAQQQPSNKIVEPLNGQFKI